MNATAVWTPEDRKNMIEKVVEEHSKATTTRTLVLLILDESGSMGSTKEETLSGLESYVENLSEKNNPDFPLYLGLYKFNTQVRGSIGMTEVEKFPMNRVRREYEPNGGTALFDAMYKGIDYVKSKKNHKDRVLVVTITDGQENSSVLHTSSQLRKKIESLSKNNQWTFAFLGADKESILSAESLGIQNVFQYAATQVGTQRAWDGLYQGTQAYLTSNKSDGTIHIDTSVK